jgi:Holliday junction resolvasome RuvABC ATP-dependent DNA helicase subunit
MNTFAISPSTLDFDFKKTATITRPLLRLAEEAERVSNDKEEEKAWIRKNDPKLSKALSGNEEEEQPQGGDESDENADADDDDSGDSSGAWGASKDDAELKYNELRSEESYWTTFSTKESVESNRREPLVVGSVQPPPLLQDIEEDKSNGMIAAGPPRLYRQDSATFISGVSFVSIDNMDDLCRFKDKNGNSAAHYAASIGLHRTAEALHRYGAPRWAPNVTHDTPASLYDGLRLGSGEDLNRLHRALTKRALVPRFALKAALHTPFDYRTPLNLSPLTEAIFAGKEDEANYYSNEAVEKNLPHAHLYRSIFFLEFKYGVLQAKPVLDIYMSRVEQQAVGELDPLYYLARYLLWRRVASPSNSKADRLLASDALTALRCFPLIAQRWLSEADDIDRQVAELGLDNVEDAIDDGEEEDYSDLVPPLGPEDPETLWETLKKNKGIKSESMDKLMNLAGLKNVKERALSVAYEVILKPPKKLNSKVSMNFLFVGNPGCGKTTVGNLLSAAMVELGYRKNPTPVLTSAGDILSAKDPGSEFAQLVKDAEGGTLFIDEAYLFTPAPKGQRANDSNNVLNYLMKVSESMSLTTTFILAGYKEEIMQLLTYNPGFASRFPKEFTFEFADYTEAQLCKILCDMVKADGFRFESQRECGVPIAKVLTRRLHRGANKKGFGNGRLCLKRLDQIKVDQKLRLGKLSLYNVEISDKEYETFTRGDTVGERPNLEENPYYKELNSMVGLFEVKAQMRSLMNLQLQNYESEMRGERPQVISLHRVFFGNPGTGKTTVARIYGRLLKEFGFLSDGDIIEVKPSDLKGQAVGEASSRTSAILEQAKGKVLFIDEAYGLDPGRNQNMYGGDVIDTLVEKIEGNAGSDMAVILAGE